MNKAQRDSYFGWRWPDACQAQGWDPLDHERRRAVTMEASRKIAGASSTSSITQLNEDQITALFKHLAALADPLNLKAQVASENPEHTQITDSKDRVIWKINQCGFHRNYVQAIAKWYCRDHRVSKWEDLPREKLLLVLNTVNKNRLKKGMPLGVYKPQKFPKTVTQDSMQFPTGHPVREYQMKPSRPLAPATTRDQNPF